MGDIETELKPYIDTFHSHSDLMTQVARFVAASSSDTSSKGSILLLNPYYVQNQKLCLNLFQTKLA